MNVRSLIPSFADVKDVLCGGGYDALGLTEIWVDPDFDCRLLAIEGYQFMYVPRTTRGGGVAVYIKDTFNVKVLLREVSDSIEHLWIKISLRHDSLVFGVVYRCHTNFQQFLGKFEDALAMTLPLAEDFCCVGDFNIDALNFNNPYFFRFADVLESLSLTQIINEPTRVTPNSATLIDFIIINSDAPMAGSGVQPVDNISDHNLIFCEFQFHGSGPKPKPITYRDYSKISHDAFLADLHSIPWFNMFDIRDVDDKVEFLANNITLLFDIHAPIVTRTFNHPNKPWITDNIKILTQRKKEAFKKCQITKSLADINDYKNIRNFTTYATRHEKKVYLNTVLQGRKQHEIWSELKRCDIHIKRKNIEVPPNLSDVNEINDYYFSVQSDGRSDPELLHFYSSSLKSSVSKVFEFHEITELDVAKAISSIDSQAIGADEISLKMIKLCCPFLLDYLRHIYNVCISNHYFPTAWKRSMIIPVAKKSNPTVYSDLRPISIIPVLSKIFEKLLASQLNQHLSESNILPECQSGFRAGYGCPGALLSINDDIISSIDRGNLVALVLLDYSKAFDTINHTLLTAILHHIGLGDGSVAFLASYLQGRTQSVGLHSNVSRSKPVLSGVPQGSILGPILFTIYTSSLYDCIKHCKYHIYADDTQIYIPFNATSLQFSLQNLNEDLKSLSILSNKHNLKLNPSKCNVIIFGNRLQRSELEKRFNAILDGKNLALCNSARNLGVIIDSELRFKKHISNLLQRAYCTLKMLYSHRNVLNHSTKVMLCDSLVLSHFNYCDVVYNNCIDAVDRKRIQRAQNSCLRFIWGVRRRERVSHLVRRTGWLSMAERRILHALSFYHNILSLKSPPYLYNRITFRTDVHNINIRRKDNLTIPNHRLEFYKKSFSYNIAKTYNSVPREVRSASLNTFKRHMKYMLISGTLVI